MNDDAINDDNNHGNDSAVEADENNVCLNCGNSLAKGDKYCPSCGQKSIDGRVTLRQFFADFFEAVFNLDSRFFRTLPAVLVPGRLTRLYFSGKHNSYIKPLRLFFTTMVVFYALLGFKHLNKLEGSIGDNNPAIMIEHAQFVDSIVANIGFDSLRADQQAIVDTILDAVHAPFNDLILTGNRDDEEELEMFWGADSTSISLRDIYTLSVDSIFHKYDIETFTEKLTIRQTIATTKHPGKVLRFVIGNTSWMILIMLPAVAAFMQLLYVRRKTYFIEHLIFLYHYHAAVFIVMTIFLLLLPLLNTVAIWIIQSLLAVFFLAAMKRYYQQSWIKTILKFLLLGIAYLILISIFGSLTGLISFFIYQ